MAGAPGHCLMRTICVWFPDWPLAGMPEEVCGFVYEEGRAAGGETERIAAANRLARQAGVTIGMGRRAAEALCPIATSKARDLGEETRRFEPVVALLEDLVPRIEVVEPGLVLIAVEGSLRFYGGEDILLDKVIGTAGPGARVGLADGPFAAHWAARTAANEPNVVENTMEFLSRLDISVIDREEMIDTFRWLGLTTLGALGELPRAAIASRFGDEGLRAHRLATGEDRPVNPRPIPPHLAVEAHYDDPLESLDQVAFSARALSARLMNDLRREGIAPHRVEIEAESAHGQVRRRVWRSADPFLEYSLVEGLGELAGQVFLLSIEEVQGEDTTLFDQVVRVLIFADCDDDLLRLEGDLRDPAGSEPVELAVRANDAGDVEAVGDGLEDLTARLIIHALLPLCRNLRSVPTVSR